MPDALTAFLLFLAFCGIAAVVFEAFLLVKLMDLKWGEAVSGVLKSFFRVDQ